MSDYVPMQGPLPGVRYMPGSGTEGCGFIEEWCANCARDLEMNGTVYEQGREAGDEDYCPILSASYRDEAAEWRDLGERTVCLAFTPKESEPPPARCEHTIDMFPPAFSTPPAP